MEIESMKRSQSNLDGVKDVQMKMYEQKVEVDRLKNIEWDFEGRVDDKV